MNTEKTIAEIKKDIEKQQNIYNDENSTTEQQQRAYRKKKQLYAELEQIAREEKICT